MVGERKKWSAGGETAGTEPERNAAAEPQTEALRHCVKLQDCRPGRARTFAERNGHGREGEGATGSP